LACTSKFQLRTPDDPRFTDRRMQLLLSSLNANLDKFNIHQLSSILYSVVKLRLPDSELISNTLNTLIDRLTSANFGQVMGLHSDAIDMTMKDLSLVIWACARIKLSRESELPSLLESKANTLLADCVSNQFMFDWSKQQGEFSEIGNEGMEESLTDSFFSDSSAKT